MTEYEGHPTEDPAGEGGLLRALAELPTEADPSRDLWIGITQRIHARPRWLLRTPATQVAAAALIFLFGLGSGWAVSTAGDPRPRPTVENAMQLAAEVQRTGSEYVAALAALAAVVDSVSADIRLQGRDAALATLYGAATELALLGGFESEEAGGRALGGSGAENIRF